MKYLGGDKYRFILVRDKRGTQRLFKIATTVGIPAGKAIRTPGFTKQD
jgi:hypothetical protein